MEESEEEKKGSDKEEEVVNLQPRTENPNLQLL